MSLARTQALLDAHLATVPNLPILQLENVRFDSAPKTFSRSTIAPAQSNVLTIGPRGQVEMQGLYQIDCYYPQDTGSQAAHQMADAIVAAFPVGLELDDDVVHVRIFVASAMTAIAMDKFYGVPVLVQWAVYV